MNGRMRLIIMAAAVIGLLAVTFNSAAADVRPRLVQETLSPGDSIKVNKLVDVPEAPPRADLYFLTDTTGSTGPVIAGFQANAAAVLAGVSGAIADVQFGAGDYKDFPFDAYAYMNAAGIGPDDGVGGAADASDAIAAWAAGGGADGPEGSFYALDQISDPGDPTGINWRGGTARILVWFGDAPGHDPVCSAISGLGYDITEASMTAKLVAANIKVIAISENSGFYAAGLNDDPVATSANYGVCGAPGGAAGQATRIAAATGGVALSGVGAGDIVKAIVNGIEQLTFKITPKTDGCDLLDISFDPAAQQEVAGGTTVKFSETITVPADIDTALLPENHTIQCTVIFNADGVAIGRQKIEITVALGRMTGGGTLAGKNVTHGFELHCDRRDLPNNLEVNWARNRFHMESLTSASCRNNPAIDPGSPPADFDTYIGKGTGRYNGVPGATIEFTFTDAGEPGRNDLARMLIKDAGGNTVLATSAVLKNGNQQAHPAH